MSKNILEFILIKHQNEVLNILKAALRGKETSNYQLPFVTKNNKTIQLVINSTSRRNYNGNMQGHDSIRPIQSILVHDCLLFENIF